VEGLFEGASLVAILAGVVALVGGALGLRGVQRRREAPPTVPPRAPEELRTDTLGDARAEERDEAPDGAPVEPSPVEAETVVAEGIPGRLARTRNLLTSAIAELVGAGLDEAAWERLEEGLIGADVGVQATTAVVAEVRRLARESGVREVEGVRTLLRDALVAELSSGERALARREGEGPTVWFITGVNGAGKTTTIGKLAAREVAAGRKVVLAAADTFRAAAAEQLGIWAERTGAELVRGAEGADPASVAYAGVDAALASGADLLIVDTAGRLQNRRELMDELGKVARVLAKRAGGIDETLLVLDGTVGQNGIAQAEAFHEAVTVTGIAITKLDGSSRGGIVVAVQRQLGLPVKLVGLGEGVEDLQDFEPQAYVDGMLAG
jgi:fused signal recognition particle receptor